MPTISASAWRKEGCMSSRATLSCGRRGPARLASTVERSSSSTSVKRGSGVSSVRQRPCSLWYASTSSTSSSSRPVPRRYLSVSSSTGKNVQVAPNSGDMLAMVARSGSESLVRPVAVELDELADHAVGAEHLGYGEDEVRGRHALGKGVRQLEADDLGDEHVVGLAEGDGLGLDAAHAPAEDAEAVDHGGVAVGADEGVGHRDAVLDDDALGQILQVDLVDDAGRGRHHGEVVEGLLAPLQELVALAVALELPLGVELQRRRLPKASTWTEWSITRSTGTSGLIFLRVPTYVLHGAPHRREVHDRRHPGEVLHDHPGRKVGELPAYRLGPVRQRLDVFLRDELAAGVPQQRFEHHPDRERQREDVPVYLLV